MKLLNDKMRKTGFYRKCKTCNKNIYIPLWLYKYRKNKERFFCSKKCWLNRHSVFHKCRTCRKIFRRGEAIVKLNKSGLLYCSRKCRYLDPNSFNAVRNGKFLNCKFCGKPMYIVPSQDIYKNKYCSIRCRSLDKDYRVLMTAPRIKGKVTKCYNCGKEIFKHRYQFKRSKLFFCSQKCSSEHLKYNRIKFAKPNNLERKFLLMIKKYNLPYRYVGDGRLWIENINPDFINCNGKKEVVEIFGDYWHNPKLNKNCKHIHTEKVRKSLLQKYGFKCIVIWEREFDNKKWEENIINKLGFDNAS